MRDSETKTERVRWDGKGVVPIVDDKPTGHFIRGPIPLHWINRVFVIGGTVAIRTALFLIYEYGLQGNPKRIVASNKGAARFRLTRYSKSKGLQRLAEVGLIRIAPRKLGQSLRVELLDYDTSR